jgi:CHAT domain/D-alanyl-D-alanine carboxypeptidase/Putative peptidoglycan binding domain
MRNITLELMRHGSDHNQLLSPLMPYLAVCENAPVTSLQQPFEHEELMTRLSALSYPNGGTGASEFVESQRAHQLSDLGRALGRMLSAVPGLTSAIGVALNDLSLKDNRARNFLNLRLVLSAKELALLPFEALISPPGFPGSGQHLLLQLSLPFSITRESRRSARTFYQAAEEPKILFVYCNLPGNEVPHQAHLMALRSALHPWMKKSQTITDFIDVLGNASLAEITEQCRKKRYTHVHILAHGVQMDDKQKASNDTAIALRAERGGVQVVDRVSARNLARALAPLDLPEEALNQPQVVTLATCNSGQGEIVPLSMKGESMAHALHEAGVPMVVASQFPLTFAGSVVMTETLYAQLLSAHDPRHAMIETRHELARRVPSSQDWASLVCYLSLAPNFEEHNQRVQLKRLRGRIVRGMLYDSDLNNDEAAPAQFNAALSEIQRFSTGVKFSLENEAHLDALRAGVYRRLGGWQRANCQRSEAVTAFTQACLNYLSAYRRRPQRFWTLTMALRLQLVLSELIVEMAPNHLKDQALNLLPLSSERCWRMLYEMVCVELELARPNNPWLLVDAIEVFLLAPEFDTAPADISVQADDCVRKLTKMINSASWPIHALRSQLKRFQVGGSLYLPGSATFAKRTLELLDLLAPEQAQVSAEAADSDAMKFIQVAGLGALGEVSNLNANHTNSNQTSETEMHVLKLGSIDNSKSNLVARWQNFLRGQGYTSAQSTSAFDQETEQATRAFQRKHKLDVDGVVGNQTYGKAAELGFELVNFVEQQLTFPAKPAFQALANTQARQKLFGPLEFESAPKPKNPEAIRITNGWDKDNLVQIVIPQLIGIEGAPKTGKVSVHRKVADQFLGLFAEFEKQQLLDKILTFAGLYDPRFIRGGAAKKALSSHAFATAFDINAKWNWLGAEPALPGKIGCLYELVPIAHQFGFYWGGHFSGRRDGMHFEVARILGSE